MQHKIGLIVKSKLQVDNKTNWQLNEPFAIDRY